jgi:hypothetical protein
MWVSSTPISVSRRDYGRLIAYETYSEGRASAQQRLDQIDLVDLTRGVFPDAPRVMLCIRLETDAELCVFYRIHVGRQSLVWRKCADLQ